MERKFLNFTLLVQKYLIRRNEENKVREIGIQSNKCHYSI